MFNLRKLIREHIRLIFKEMEQSLPHFPDRRFQRLHSTLTDFPGKYEWFGEEVTNAIDFLIRKLTIKSRYSMAVFIKCPQVYRAKNVDVSKGTSIGNILYIICKGNVLTTLFFDDMNRTNQQNEVDFKISFKDLKKYIEENNKFILDDQDMRNLSNLNKKPKPQQVEEPKEFIYVINGKKYGVDVKKNSIYVKNKPSLNYNLFDVLDDKIPEIKLNDELKDDLLSKVI